MVALKTGIASGDEVALTPISSQAALASTFPPPRVPSAPVLSFGALFDSANGGAAVPSLLDIASTLLLTSGRVALAMALKLQQLDAEHEVLLPAYNCRSMVDAVSWVGAKPVLYRSGADLAVDFDDVAAKVTERTRCLVVIHYFGFPQNLEKLRAFCDERRIALLEDCAHCFFGSSKGKPIGSVGDYAIASPMKFFPIYDGGLLASARHAVADVPLRAGGAGFEIKALVNNLERSFAYSRLRPLNWLMAPVVYAKDRVWSLAKKFRTPLANDSIGPDASGGSYEFDPRWVGVRMSAVSSALLRRTSVSRMAERRRAHYRVLLAAFSGERHCRPLYPELPDGAVPYVFPLVVDNPDRSFPRLKARGVPLFRWEDVDETVCATSARYARHLFQLPCHQELSAEDLRWLISEVKLAVEL